MQLINCSTEDFKVASTKTEGIPSHAVEIQGELININKKFLTAICIIEKLNTLIIT